MRAFLTLMGMYEYDNTLFSRMVYPDKWTNTDIEAFTYKLLFDTAELEILYPEPETMKQAIAYWSKAYVTNWNKLYNTTVLDYNPIWNKDGTITESETIGRTHSDTEKGTETQSTTQNAESTTNTDSTEKDYVFGFNSSNRAQSGEIDTETEEKSNGTVTGSGNTSRNTDRSGSDDETRDYTRREQGNIGVTTTQQMIREERDIDTFNLMDYIINDFKNHFCILVY